MPDATSDLKTRELTAKLRRLQKADRAIMEKATRAFVSHIRAYSKHECSLLLKVKQPWQPHWSFTTSEFSPIPDLDFNLIPYKDKQREAQRKQKLEIYKSTGVWPGQKNKPHMKKTEPWSKTKEQKEQKKAKRLKRKQIKAEKVANNGPVKKKKRKAGMSEEDMAELAKDVALCKKLKKKKISDEEFEKQMGLC